LGHSGRFSIEVWADLPSTGSLSGIYSHSEDSPTSQFQGAGRSFSNIVMKQTVAGWIGTGAVCCGVAFSILNSPESPPMWLIALIQIGLVGFDQTHFNF